jgi:hypothetical protein
MRSKVAGVPRRPAATGAHDVWQLSLTVWPRTAGGSGLGRFPISPETAPELLPYTSVPSQPVRVLLLA